MGNKTKKQKRFKVYKDNKEHIKASGVQKVTELIIQVLSTRQSFKFSFTQTRAGVSLPELGQTGQREVMFSICVLEVPLKQMCQHNFQFVRDKMSGDMGFCGLCLLRWRNRMKHFQLQHQRIHVLFCSFLLSTHTFELKLGCSCLEFQIGILYLISMYFISLLKMNKSINWPSSLQPCLDEDVWPFVHIPCWMSQGTNF